MKKKIIYPGARGAGKSTKAGQPTPPTYPIFAMRLCPNDKAAIFYIKNHYGLKSLVSAIRLGLRILITLKLTEDQVREYNDRYEVTHPDAPHIFIPRTPARVPRNTSLSH